MSEEVGHAPAATQCVRGRRHCILVGFERCAPPGFACSRCDLQRAATQVKIAMFEYGRHLGLAFQVVDDILDFTQTSEQLGKPQVRRRFGLPQQR